MRRIVITEGSTFDTIDGYVTVNRINEAGLCYCDHYYWGEYEPEDMTVAEDRLTKYDIEALMHQYDGKNYSVRVDR